MEMNEEAFAQLKSRIIHRVESAGYHQLLGIKVIDLQPGRCTTAMEVGPEYLNPNGWLHGGVITSLSDTTAGTAASSMGYRVTTVNMTTEFMRRGPASGKIFCRTNVIKGGRTLMWIRAEVYDENDTVLSETTFVFFLLEKLDPEKYLERK